MKARRDVADADLRRADEAEFAQRVGGERDGVVEEAAQEVDAAAARAHQHHALGIGIGLRVGVERLERAMAILVGDDGMAGAFVRDRHQVEPPLHHAVGLREEAVAADVHAVALVADRARDAADGVIGFEHDGANGRFAFRCLSGPAQQLQRSSKTGGTGADDDGGALAHCVRAKRPAMQVATS